jgi:transposase
MLEFASSLQPTQADNTILWFQPPYSPDCNPIERLWVWIKGQLVSNVHQPHG